MKTLRNLFLLLVLLSLVGLSSCSRTIIPEPVDDIVQIADLHGKWQGIYDADEWAPLTLIPDSVGFLFYEFRGDTVDAWFLSTSGGNDSPVFTSLVEVDSILAPYQATLAFTALSYSTDDTTVFVNQPADPFHLDIELDPGMSFTVIRHPNGDTIPQVEYVYIN